jgi:hypothetical protein
MKNWLTKFAATLTGVAGIVAIYVQQGVTLTSIAEIISAAGGIALVWGARNAAQKIEDKIAR